MGVQYSRKAGTAMTRTTVVITTIITIAIAAIALIFSGIGNSALIAIIANVAMTLTFAFYALFGQKP